MQTLPTTGEEKDNRGIALGKVLRDRTAMPLDAFKEKYGCCFLLLQENSTRTQRRRHPTREMRSVRELKTSNIQLLVFPLRRFQDPEDALGVITIGRTQHNDVCIPDISISRVHAVLKSRLDQVFLSDIGSRNGTFVGDEKLEKDRPHVMESGMQIRIGAVICEFARAEDLPHWS